MSENLSKDLVAGGSDAKPEKAVTVPFAEHPDWFLRALVRAAQNDGYIGLGLTLQMGGLLVSGALINPKEYFEEFSKMMAKAHIDYVDYALLLRKDIAALGEILDPKAYPTYIHLKEAQYFTPAGDPIPSNSMSLWRGRINRVDGFSLGALEKKIPK